MAKYGMGVVGVNGGRIDNVEELKKIMIKPIRDQQPYNQSLKEIEQLWGTEHGAPKGDGLEVLMTLVEIVDYLASFIVQFTLCNIRQPQGIAPYNGNARKNVGAIPCSCPMKDADYLLLIL